MRFRIEVIVSVPLRVKLRLNLADATARGGGCVEVRRGCRSRRASFARPLFSRRGRAPFLSLLYTEEERRVSALSARVAAPSAPAFSLLDVPADALGSAFDATRKKGREQRVLSVNWGAGKMHDQKYSSPGETLSSKKFLAFLAFTQPAFPLSDPDRPFFH